MTLIAEGLAERFLVCALCGLPNYSQRGICVPRRETHNGVEIVRSWSTTLNKDRLAFRLINMATSTLGLFAASLRSVRRGDVVMVGTNPPTLPFFVAIACRLRGAKMFLRLDDVYPDAMVRAGLIREHSAWRRCHDLLNRWLYRKCERIVAVGRDMAELVARKVTPHELPLIYIPNWADVDRIEQRASGPNRLRRAHGLEAKFVVGYAGNMGPLQGMGHLLDCAEALRMQPNVHFLLVGSGKLSDWTARQVAERRLANVTLAGQFPRNAQNDFLSAFDLGLVSLVAGMSGVGVPSRSYNLMAAGLPLLAVLDLESEIARMIREERVGWAVPPDDIAGFVAAVQAAAADSAALAGMSRRARAAAEARYSRAAVVRQYVALFS